MILSSSISSSSSSLRFEMLVSLSLHLAHTDRHANVRSLWPAPCAWRLLARGLVRLVGATNNKIDFSAPPFAPTAFHRHGRAINIIMFVDTITYIINAMEGSRNHSG
jgi:hypothetical protein